MSRHGVVDKERIIRLRRLKMTYAQIGKICGCSAVYAYKVYAAYMETQNGKW